MLDRELANFLVPRVAQYEYGNLGRCEIELIERLDSGVVGEEEIDQYGRYPVPARSRAFCSAAESRLTFGAGPNPFDLELSAARIGQRVPHHNGIRGIVLNE